MSLQFVRAVAIAGLNKGVSLERAMQKKQVYIYTNLIVHYCYRKIPDSVHKDAKFCINKSVIEL